MKKKLKYISHLCVIILILMIVSGCGLINRNDSNKKTIVTTMYPQYNFISEIIGTDKRLNEYFDVSIVIPPGADSHTFDPRLNDLIKIKNADLFIYTSDEIEQWVKKLEISNYTKVLNLSSDERIELIMVEEHDHDDHHHEHHSHEYDPHYWVYPIYACYMVDSIRNKILEICPELAQEGKDIINANADAYIEKLMKLDEKIKQVSNLKKTNKLYFASPFSFYYWSYYYDFEYVLTYSTCSTEVEPALTTIIDVINDIKENDVKVIYVKELLNDEVAKKISDYTGAQILLLHSCHNVSKEEFDANISFIEIMENNIKNLGIGLGLDIEQIEEIFREGE